MCYETWTFWTNSFLRILSFHQSVTIFGDSNMITVFFLFFFRLGRREITRFNLGNFIRFAYRSETLVL